MDTKRCARCCTTKPVTEYYRNKARKDGVSVYCMACHCEVDDGREKRQRAELVALLGGACRRCGYNGNPAAFQVDHVNGGGAAERRSGLRAYAASLLRQVKADPEKFQLLCANCNTIKKLTGREVGTRVYGLPPLTERVLKSGVHQTKRCPRCDVVKPVAAFSRSPGRHDGVNGYCRACLNAINAANAQRQRAELISRLGGACRTCGFNEPLALQVDHVNGDGAAARRLAGNSHARTLMRLATELPSDFQVLCANCNVIKRAENREHIGSRVYRRVVLTSRTMTGRAHVGPARTAAAEAKRAVWLAEVDQRRPQERSTARLPRGSWAQRYHRCLGCQWTDRKHAADGLCYACNSRAKGYGRRTSVTDTVTLS